MFSLGGVSFFSGRYGFACNNIKAYEVVLGNGSIVTATSTRNPRLFRALRGGSNNFGIVTRFDANLFQQGEFWGGQIDQPFTNKEEYFSFMANFTQMEMLSRSVKLLNDDQTMKVVVNSLQGTQILSLLANIVHLFHLESVTSATELGFPDFTVRFHFKYTIKY